ncbi:MAG: DUF2568 domain-containing protein [Paracoccaceae bacterium]
MLKAFNHILAFLLELAALAAVALWAWQQPQSLLLRMTASALATGGVALLWARFAAPRAAQRLAGPGLVTVKLLVFGAAAACLLATLGPGWAALFVAGVPMHLLLALALDRL